MKDIHLVSMSYGRACLNPHFIDRFYEIFLESHPEIKPMFKNTDFSKQRQLLKKSIVMLLAHFEGDNTWTNDLLYIAKRHSTTGGLTISPELYQYWIASLIAALKEHDSQWTSGIEQAWERVLQAGVNFLIEHYKNPEESLVE